MTFRNLALAVTAALLASGSVAALAFQDRPCVDGPSTTSGKCEIPFSRSQDIGHGLALDTLFQSTGPLIDPETSERVRAVSLLLEVHHGLSQLQTIHSLETRAASDAAPLTFRLAGLSASTADASLTDDPHAYTIRVTPKAGHTWFEATTVQDLDVVATETE